MATKTKHAGDSVTGKPSGQDMPSHVAKRPPSKGAKKAGMVSGGHKSIRVLDYGATQPRAPARGSPFDFRNVVKTFRQILRTAGVEEAQSKIEKLVDIYRSGIPAPRFSMAEARMVAKAQEKTILATQWLTAKDIAELAGYKSSNKAAGVFKWKADHKIFGVKYLSEELYPIYALNKENGFRPYPGLKPVLELFSGKRDSWAIAYWFAAANGYLGGKRPQDLIAEQPDLVLKAAVDSLEGVTHG